MKGRIDTVRSFIRNIHPITRSMNFLSNLWADFCVLKHYVGGIPDWRNWQKERPRRQRIEDKHDVERPLNIAYVTQYARARELKLAYAARLCGHQVTLIASGVQFPDMVNEYFDDIRSAKNVWQMLKALDEINPDVVHLFVNYNNAFLLPILLYSTSPVIYDPYDCLKGMFKPEFQINRLELRAERMSFKRAEHICSRSLEPLYLRRKFGYQMPDTTYFAEYCWKEPKPYDPRNRFREADLHIVYVGGIWPEDRYPADKFGYAQYIEVSRILAKQNIHLHIYPAPTPAISNFECFFSLYLEEAANNPYLHFYHPVNYDELMQVLPRFDAAMHIMGLTINENLGRLARPKLDYSSANKLFDYIEAGLPVIIHNGKHQKNLVRHYSHIIEVQDLANVREAILTLNFHKKPSHVTIKDHAERLGQMYSKLGVK